VPVRAFPAACLMILPLTAHAEEATRHAPSPESRPNPESESEPDPGWLRPSRFGDARRPIQRRPPPPDRAWWATGKPRTFYVALEAGPSYGNIYGFSTYGGEVAAAADLELSAIALGIGPTFSYAVLEPGRTVTRLQFGTSFMGRFGIFRVGAGFGLGYVSVSSVTADPSSTDFILASSLLTSIDFYKFGNEKSALYVGAKLRADLVIASDAEPVIWGPSLVFGARL
jgi:hypothetical protein